MWCTTCDDISPRMPPSTWIPFVAKDSRCGWMTSLMTGQSHQREYGYLRGAGKPPGSRHNSPDELKRASFHFLPNYGTILPSSGATFCHCRAQSDASGENFREVYHRHSEYAFRLQEAWFCSWKTSLSILPFTLHLFAGNPDKHWGCERWRVGSTLHHPSPTLHLITKSSHHWRRKLVIIDDWTWVQG